MSVIASPGSSIGGRSAFIIFPEDGLVLAVLSNVTEAEVPPIWQVLAQAFLEDGS